MSTVHTITLLPMSLRIAPLPLLAVFQCENNYSGPESESDSTTLKGTDLYTKLKPSSINFSVTSPTWSGPIDVDTTLVVIENAARRIICIDFNVSQLWL